MLEMLSRNFKSRAWSDSWLRGLFSLLRKRERHALVVWDCKAQPYSVGDMIQFLVASNIMIKCGGVAKVDVCFLLEPEARYADPAVKAIDDYSARCYIDQLLSLANAFESTGDLVLFESREELERYVAGRADGSIVWPPYSSYREGEFLQRKIYDLIYDCWQKNGGIPKFRFRRIFHDWARAFISEKAKGFVPVAVSIRNNLLNGPERNSNMEAWLEFFDWCCGRYPVKFFAVCARDEVDHRLKNRPNVIITKEYCTSLVEDLAIVLESAAFIGPPSGPGAAAFFGQAGPVASINHPRHDFVIARSVAGPREVSKFVFFSEFQRFVHEKDTIDVLVEEFDLLLKGIDMDKAVIRAVLENPLRPDASMRLR